MDFVFFDSFCVFPFLVINMIFIVVLLISIGYEAAMKCSIS